VTRLHDEFDRGDSLVAALFFVATVLMAAAAEVRPVVTLWLYAGLFLPYAYFIHRSISSRALNPVVALALAVRFALVFAEPVLSDDLYRYVWEGRVSLAAHNPYYLAPDSEVLLRLRDAEIWPKINHPAIPTVYPPMAQFAFAFNALWNGGTTSMRLIFVAVEIVTVYVLWRWTRGDEGSWRLPALTIYALNPLVFVETAWSGHLDVIAWCSLVLAISVWSKGDSPAHGAHAGLWLGMSIAAKFLGLMALAALVLAPFRAAAWRPALAKRAALLATVCLIVGASYLPYVEAGPKLFDGLGTYAATWRSNDGGFRLVADTTEYAISTWAPDSWRYSEGPDSKVLVRLSALDEIFLRYGWTRDDDGQTIAATTFSAGQIAGTTAKLVALLIMGLALLWCLLVERDPFRRFAILMLTLLFVAPTVHPWYVAWLVPFAALRPRSADLAFSGLCLMAYGAWLSVARGGTWSLPAWVVAIEYLTVLALIILGPHRLRGFDEPMPASTRTHEPSRLRTNELAGMSSL